MRALLIAVLAAAVLAPAAGATFPGKNGRLVYSGDENLYSILPTGKGQRQITRGIDGNARFSPNGSRIAFERQEGLGASARSHIWVASADGSGAHPVTSVDPGEPTPIYDAQPAWTWDGQLMYSRSASRNADAFCILSQAAVLSAPATTVRCGDGGDIIDSPLPNPLDDRLAFFQVRPRDGRPGMIFADQLWVNGAPTSVLATRGDWSPDGKRLLLRQPSGFLGIYDVARDVLTQLSVKSYAFAWSPDGLSLAYVAKGKIWIAAANGSKARAVTTKPPATAGGLAWQSLPR